MRPFISTMDKSSLLNLMGSPAGPCKTSLHPPSSSSSSSAPSLTGTSSSSLPVQYDVLVLSNGIICYVLTRKLHNPYKCTEAVVRSQITRKQAVAHHAVHTVEVCSGPPNPTSCVHVGHQTWSRPAAHCWCAAATC